MASAEEGDILAYVASGKGTGTTLMAECQALLASATLDALTKDFVAGRFFEVTDMSLGMSLSGMEEGSGVDYQSWIRRPAAGDSKVRYRVAPERLSFTRLIDCASPQLMQFCLGRTPLDRVVLVKRHSVGDRPLGYARFELGTPTLTSVRWADGDAVTETCSFSFQALTVTTRSFGADGTPSEAKSGVWTNAAAGREG